MNIIIQPSAKRDLRKLNKSAIEIILRKLNRIKVNPTTKFSDLKDTLCPKVRDIFRW